MTTAVAARARPIHGSHLDLLTRPVHAVLTTMGPGGQPQSTLVWADVQDGVAVVNTTLQRQKARNMVANPKASLLIVDPENTSRYIQIRGDAELTTEGALGHLDAITRKYTGYPAFYGYVYPAEQRTRETRAVCRIHARWISLDAIHIADH
jgi:PPOX class probable F420-dependent enzyme